ncbi:Aats-ala-m, partial [Drosophila busckii]
MYNSAKQLQRVLTAREIRKAFIDYFTINHEHKFVRSSPVVPFCDPTVAFVNAGMNQFKSVFLGNSEAPHKRVVNSQKCVRVGGKHNDLTVVGQDGYHHTFFEMLGNWSFGDYFKHEACAMALELLRGPYNIDPARMYVTYFAGDKLLGIPADLECFEIWRSLGFPASRILPFGCEDNFWEMGATGPCGPCTEIHIDHRPGDVEQRAKLVNAGRPDLTELWNLVFIQYNRNADGSISPLPAHHVDTGMGFERLTALLQNKSSNYDTDLFTPLFDGIHSITKAPLYTGSFPDAHDAALLDTSYRILADHARMITVCLADGMLPDQNQKLRRVLRKALSISEQVFAHEQLLAQLVPIVVETLGEAYPELCSKQQAIVELIAHERDVYKQLRASSSKAFAEVLSEFPKLDDIDLMECPGFVPAYRELQVQRSSFTNNTIPGEFLYKLTDTYGLNEESFLKLAELENMNCDLERYRAELALAKLRTKQPQRTQSSGYDFALEQRIVDAQAQLTQRLSPTDNSYKYVYSYEPESESYALPTVQSRVLGLLHNDEEVSHMLGSRFCNANDTLSIVTEASNFYYESGGQQSDLGQLIIRNKQQPGQPHRLDVVCVKHLNNCVVHVCRLVTPTDDFELAVGDELELQVDPKQRQLNTCHHTATHLLNAAIRTLFKKVTYQVSSSVSNDQCKLELGLLGKRIDKIDVEHIEDLINRAICSGTPVQVLELSAAEVLQQNDITMVPGEVYPEQGLRLINVQCQELGLSSKELCCGTHVTNTKELSCFCIVNLRQTNRARFAFTAVAGEAAEKVLKTAALLRHRVDLLEQQFRTDKLTNATETELQTIRHNMLHSDIKLPFAFKLDTLERINELLRRLKETSRTTLKEFVEVEMRTLLLEKPLDTHPFILHYISSSALLEEIPLQRATKLCTDRPILVVSMCDNVLKARCCVPEHCISANFNAQLWLQCFADTFGGQVAAPKGQNVAVVCNMRGRKVNNQFEEQLEQAMRQANAYAKQHL